MKITDEKIKPWEKHKLLESAVMRDTPNEVDKLYKRLGKVEFTARALGIACRYRGLDMVKTLAENGASFRYDYDEVKKLFRKADCNIDITYEDENFSLALLNSEKMLYIQQIIGLSKSCRLELIPLISRLMILKYLYKNAEKIGFKPDEFMFFAYFAEEWDMVSELKSRGTALSEKWVKIITEAGGGDYWLNYCYLTNMLDNERFIRAMTALTFEIGDDKKLHFTEHFCYMNEERFFNSQYLPFFLEHFNQSKMNKGNLIKDMIDHENIPCLEIIAKEGWLKPPRKRDEMIEYAMNKNKTESTAFLLDFKNRTANLDAERQKAEKKAERELYADPNSLTELKRNWSYKKKDDGTLVITGYKGKSTLLTVPAKIGADKVTEIGNWALSPHAPRIKDHARQFRKTIKKVVLPEGLIRIGQSAFCDLNMLESVNIPTTVRFIGEYAFRDCNSLKTVIVPKGVSNIEANAFSVQNGMGALEYVELPKTLKYFSKDCKWWRMYLFHSANCPKLVVGVPHAPHVEEFCEHNKVKFVYTEDKK